MYINPIEILGLSDATDTISIDNEIIKKAKRKLFAEIDLSDNGVFEYYGQQLTKGNCEKAIDELGNKEYKEYYLYLANNRPLNEFLINGNLRFLFGFKQDSIFKLPEFVKFISPYFTLKYDKALLMAFEEDNAGQTKAILNTSSLIAQSDVNKAFKSISNSIQNRITEIDEITKNIKKEESDYDEDNIEHVVELVKEYFPTNTLNCLPQYFQSQILKVANSINYLSNSIWDAFDSTQVPNDLTEYLLTLNIGGLDRPTFENNFKIIKRKNDERLEQNKNAPTLRKYATYLIQTKSKIQELEKKSILPSVIQNWVDSNLSISDVNNLPSIFDEIKNQVALSLRAMSIEVWNSHSNIEIALNFINKANTIVGLKPDVKNKIIEAEVKLLEIKRKLGTRNLISHQTRSFSAPSETKADNSGFVWLIGIAVIIGLVMWVEGSNKTSSNDYPTTTTDNHSNPATTGNNGYSNDNSTNTAPTTTDEYSPPIESHYKGNQLVDGASPFDGCFGKGLYGGNATLTIMNGSSSDAIVCLYSIIDNKTIRNEYVKKNSSFEMSSIAQGEYKIRVFYGNDWNPKIENSCGTKGNFESDINFSEFDGTQYFEDSERGYTNATVTLYSVVGGNATSSAIDQSQFFSK